MEKNIEGTNYKIVDDEIQTGDLIYNVFAGTIDKCIYKCSDGDMCVEFPNGNRAVFGQNNYKKVVSQ